ncbi:MAG TPA: hypothetical protein VM639_22765 [Dongiaceae bacterium]|nr:hypothetical protein [Dongiaceae bacterium]
MITHRSKRRALIVLAALVLVSAAGLALHFYLGGADAAREQARLGFIATCKEQGRVANGGGAALRMDDATEEGLDLYCGCVADHFDQALTPAEITAVGAGTASQDVLARLNAVVSTCQAQHLTPAPEPAPDRPSSGTSP